MRSRSAACEADPRGMHAAELRTILDDVAGQERFAGVVRVDIGGRTLLCRAYGEADRNVPVPNAMDTIFAIASGTKAFTALAVMSLVEAGTLALDAPVRRWLSDDLPLVADDVTVAHLLSHTGGIGDYLDEDALGDITDYVLATPVHQLATAEDYLAVLDGYPMVARAGERFAYNNGGYVVLALVAERAAGIAYHDLVADRVIRPAGMVDTCFPRSDTQADRVATGYLAGPGDLRTNVLHMPLRGVGDGGAASTVADVAAFWTALDAGRIVSRPTLDLMTTEHGRPDNDPRGYGLGFWLQKDAVILEGYDPGISFRTLHRASNGLTWTVVSNWSEGAWPIARALDEAFPIS